MCAEVFAIFSQLEANISLEHFADLIEKKLENEIINFDSIMILMDTCYKRLCDGKLMNNSVSHQKLANIIDMLIVQIDLIAEKNPLLLVQDLRPNNVKTYLQIMPIIEKQYLINFIGILSDSISNNLLADCFSIADWNEIYDLLNNCIVEEHHQSQLSTLKNLIKDQAKKSVEYESFLKENNINLNEPVNITKPL